MRYTFLSLFFMINLIQSEAVMAQPLTPFLVKADQPIAEIQSTMWGIFFEDINFAADGGLYAELVKNRSFEFAQPMMGWKEEKRNILNTNILIINQAAENPDNPRFARVIIKDSEPVGLSNEGFRGMGIKKGVEYHFSTWARQNAGTPITLRIELVNQQGAIIGKTALKPSGNTWKNYQITFSATDTDPKAKLNIWLEGEAKSSIDLDMISLFPGDTWKNRPGGLRADLVQLLADLKPGFIRFPGGCIVEGRELTTRYQWKKTVGKVEDREMIVNRWNTEFQHRPTPDYFQTFGLGFFEYFQLAEDIGAEPLPILSCGMACQFNTAEVVPLDEIDPYIQDVLDLIEFANGSPETTWGKVRAEMGHPAPFNLKFVGVGNEHWGEQYIERYEVFAEAIKAKYPNIKLVSGSGPFPDGELFDYAHKELKALGAELVDEHYYRDPNWFLKNADRYDKYDRQGPKIFAGEYAAQSVATVSPDNKNNWRCALAEAAFMTGLERNAAVVNLSSYAPLFAHTEAWQWSPNLIWFDNLRSFGTPNYYVQKLFANNRGTHVLPLSQQNKPLTGQNGLYASAVLDKGSNEIIIKIVNATDKAQTQEITLEGIKKLNQKGTIMVLKSDNLEEMNTLDNPMQISPIEQELIIKGKKLNLNLAANSLSVVKIKLI